MQDFFLPNPDYGTGTFWRRIRLENGSGWTLCEFEDFYHAMRCRLSHAGGVVTRVDTEMLRIPMTTCAGAGEVLKSLVGTGLDTPLLKFYGGGCARSNCTHLFDLAWLALAHASRAETERRYDATIPDAINGRSTITLARDNDIVCQWDVVEHDIQAPVGLRGANLAKGFTSWAYGMLAGDELEAALVLHKAYFVAGSRRFVMDPSAPRPGIDEALRDVCFGFAAERVAGARRLETQRDFADIDELLRLPPPAWG